MTLIEIEELTTRDRAVLMDARDLADELGRLRDALREMELETISSPNMDGMPAGSSDGDGMTRRLARIDSLRSKIDREEQRFERLKRGGRRAIRGLQAKERMFLEAYYLDAEKAVTAAMIARISDKTAGRYIKRIEKREAGD